jgi:uncharacterized protein (TIGR03435 family)
VTVDTFAGNLSGPLNAEVTSTTGTPGLYDFVFVFTPADFPPENETAGPMLPAALKQFGLELTKAKVPTDTFVVDSISAPTPN